jgi:transcriptional regulator with XRE-family HTH domain
MYGAFVRAAREARHLTQHDVAVSSGVLQSNISAIENGRRIPSADTLNRLLVACGFELAATSAGLTIHCPLPDDDPWPGGVPADPPDERPSLPAGASATERAQVLTAVLDAVDATRRR